MIFFELINKYNFEDLKEICYKKHILKESYAEILFNNVKQYFNNTDKTSDTDLTHLFISIEEDCFVDEDSISEVFPYCYSVSGYTEYSSNEHFSLTFLEWHNYKNLIIDKVCLEVLGEKECLLAILYEMSWLGIDYDTVKENIEKETIILKEACSTIKNGGKTYSLEEVFKDLNIDYKEKDDKFIKELKETYLIDSGNRICSEALKGSFTPENSFWNYSLDIEEKQQIRAFIKNGIYGLQLLKKCQLVFPEKDFEIKNLNV